MNKMDIMNKIKMNKNEHNEQSKVIMNKMNKVIMNKNDKWKKYERMNKNYEQNKNVQNQLKLSKSVQE